MTDHRPRSIVWATSARSLPRAAVLGLVLAAGCSAPSGRTRAADTAPDVGDVGPDVVADAASEPVGDAPIDEEDTSIPDRVDADGPNDSDAGAGDAPVLDVADVSDDAREDPFVDDRPLEATGFFHVARRTDRWWLVTPGGAPFLSLGVNHVGPRADTDRETGRCPYCEAVDARYASHEAWADAAASRLASWGFNTVGAWSDTGLLGPRMPYTEILNMSGANWQSGAVPDYFADEFEARCEAIAADRVASRADDANLVGWFIDNELRWGRDWRAPRTLLDDYLELPEGSAGRAVAESYAGDSDAFLAALAERYFSVTTAAIRRHDPNHLVLGTREISVMTRPQVLDAAGRYLDVLSVNNYTFNRAVYDTVDALFGPFVPHEPWLFEHHRRTGLPVLITEFSFRAADSGLPNSFPPIYPVLATQEDRADAYEAYARRSFDASWVVGFHWFEWADEPPGGRFDGEDSNFGLVDLSDDPWEVLTERMTAVNADAPHLDRAASGE